LWVADVASFKIPTRIDGIPAYTQTVSLDQIDYRMTMRWSKVESAWYMDLRTADDEDIIVGQKVVAETDLLLGFASDDRPAGSIICLPAEAQEGDVPAIDTLGTDFWLVYVTDD